MDSWFGIMVALSLVGSVVPAILKLPVTVSPPVDSQLTSILRPVDPTEPDALLKFIVSELERAKRESGTLGGCEGIEVAHIINKNHTVENGRKYEIHLNVKPVHIVTDKCNNNVVKDIIPSTLEDCLIEVWEGLEPAGEMHPMALLRSSCKIQKD